MTSSDNRERYRRFCEEEKNLPLFLQHWWLEAVTSVWGGEWNAAIEEKGGVVRGVLPYVIQNGLIINPPFVSRLGPYLIYPSDAKYQTRLHQDIEVMNGLIDQLPPYRYYGMQFFYDVQNWLAFYWKNFSATPRYSYIIPAGSELAVVEREFHPNIRKSIAKASRDLEVGTSEDIGIVYKMVEEVNSRKKLNIALPEELYRVLDRAAAERGCRKIVTISDSQGNIHAAKFFAWDNRFVYSLAGGADSRLRSSQAATLAYYEGIKLALSLGRGFDFEGTMLKEVESHFRQFGGRQTTYFQVTKENRTFFGRGTDYLRRKLFAR